MRSPLPSLLLPFLLLVFSCFVVVAEDRDPPPVYAPDAPTRTDQSPAQHNSQRAATSPPTSREILAKYYAQKKSNDAAGNGDDKDDADKKNAKNGKLENEDGNDTNKDQEKATKKDEPKKPRFDPAVVSAGESAFNRSCTSCHDAEKSYSKTKSLSAWRACVLRMAGKSGADIPSSDVDPISTYLASRNASNTNGGTGDAGASDANTGDVSATDTPPVTIYGTFSPTWRGGNSKLENPDFFPDAWVGAQWQTSSPISAKATACVTCHEGQEAHRIELVEASMKYDLSKMFDNQCGRNTKLSIEGGRFVVPFGAFAAQSNPGVYRTVSKPLIFDMGQRVRLNDIGDSVLPMPYSDQGANIDFSTEMFCEQTLGFNVYTVNGLQGGANGVNFYQSRAYNDNNTLPAVGTRVTFGDQNIKFGSSFMSGQFGPTGGVAGLNQNLYYRVYGWDLTLRHKDRLRVQFEYARRDSDIIDFANAPFRTRDHIDGYYIEGEYQFAPEKKISFLSRYDWLHHQSLVPVAGSALPTGVFGVSRFTYGLNFVLANGSLLMINHEHWFMPGNLPNADVLGVRWACTF